MCLYHRECILFLCKELIHVKFCSISFKKTLCYDFNLQFILVTLVIEPLLPGIYSIINPLCFLKLLQVISGVSQLQSHKANLA